MLREELLAILVCPACKTRVDLVGNKWLVCRNDKCRRKYPIQDGIPNMRVQEGNKYVDVAIEDLDQVEV